MSCPSTTGAFAAAAHPSGTARTAASVAGLTRTIATSRVESATSTVPATLTAGVNCTSTDSAAPIHAGSSQSGRSCRPRIPSRAPSASIARRRCPAIASGGSTGRQPAAWRTSPRRGATDSTSAFAAVSSRVASYRRRCPRVASTGALAAERNRLVRFNRVVSGTQPHFRGPVRRRDDPPRRSARRIVADEQHVARHRVAVPASVRATLMCRTLSACAAAPPAAPSQSGIPGRARGA